MNIKQWHPPAVKGIVVPIVMIVVVVAALWGVNVARTSLMAGSNIEQSVVFAALTRAFFLINLFVFAAALYLSFSAHDENAQLDKSQTESDKLDKKIMKLDKKLGKHSGALDARRAAHEAGVNRTISQFVELAHEYRGTNERARTGPVPQAHSIPPSVVVPPHLDREVQQPVSEREIEEWREVWRNIRASDATTRPTLPRAGN